jgi:hypothetical protein
MSSTLAGKGLTKILLLLSICHQAYPVPDGTKLKMCVTRFVDQ